MGLAEPLPAALAPLESRILAAFIFESVAKRQDTASSDVDLMVVSDELTCKPVRGRTNASAGGHSVERDHGAVCVASSRRRNERAAHDA